MSISRPSNDTVKTRVNSQSALLPFILERFNLLIVRFWVLMTMSIETAVFFYGTPCRFERYSSSSYFYVNNYVLKYKSYSLSPWGPHRLSSNGYCGYLPGGKAVGA